MSERDLQAMIEAIVRGRRQRRRHLDADEVRLAATAAALRAGRTEVAGPDPAFVDSLARRLRRADADEAGLPPAGLRRRQFLAASGVAAAAAVAGVAGDRLVEHLRETPAPPASPSLVPVSGVWHPVATLAEVGEGGSLAFTARGVSGVVVRRGGTVSAVSAVCTHQGCLLALDSAKSLLRCPCHPVNFDLSGSQVTGAYPLPSLPRLSARVTGEQIEVLLPA